MNRYICVHGHFYQPPRENSWLEEVELQDSAYPYHDWNERITVECYDPNTASRILDKDNKIIDIINNYARMSFNFGPTLLSWMERHKPETYKMILFADKLSQETFSGHGSAIAQVYNHMIMPLANSRDKRTQVIWGIKDFEYRFKRYPEGMWLAETAVDLETLDIMTEFGIKFTILSPYQAKRIRKIGQKQWKDAKNGKIDPKTPYFCNLPSGRTISIFFYDGPVSRDTAFGELLNKGENFANRLIGTFSDGKKDKPQFVHIATDGETYGHHHPYGEMALSYGFYYVEENKLAKITIYGEYLASFPPIHEVEIIEGSSWSCFHGVERWRSNCGCKIGTNPKWNQAWRAPLRSAMDWLRDSFIKLYEEQALKFLKDPWAARDDYIEVILNRNQDNINAFLSKHANSELSPEAKVTLLKLLEMQRHAMLMYTSCGWFFDEISGIETVQVIQYAARAIQLAKEISTMDFEPAFVKLLERAKSNISYHKNGAKIYEKFVKPIMLDLPRVGAHYAISSLFTDYPEHAKIYCYRTENRDYKRIEIGKQKIVLGTALIKSCITLEENLISFAVLHLGDHNLIGGVRDFLGEEAFITMYQQITESFEKSDVANIVHLVDKHFGGHSYSFWHLFKDEQRKILDQVLDPIIKEIENSLRQLNEHHYPAIRVMKETGVPLPKVFSATMALMLNVDIQNTLQSKKLDLVRLDNLVQEIQLWSFASDEPMLGFVGSEKITQLMEEFQKTPEDTLLLSTLETLFKILEPLSLQLSLWKSQNIYFSIGKKIYPRMQERAQNNDESAKKWLEHFNSLGNYLRIRNP